jgi:cobalt-zinc-cadmium efflux system membrane fusion protein
MANHLKILSQKASSLAKRLADPKWQLVALVLIITLLIGYQFWHLSGGALPKKVSRIAVTIEGGKTLRFPTDAPQLAYLKISAADLQPVPLVEPFSGHVAYNENLTTRLFAPVAGRIIRVLAEPGDTVVAGQPLLLLDAPDFADVGKAASELKVSQSAYERAKALFEQDVIPRRSLEEAENQLHQAEAEQQRTHVRLRHLQLTNQGVSLLAPHAGTVMERKASPGMEVSPSGDQALLVISDPKQVWIIAEVPEQSLNKVAKKQPIQIFVDAYPDQTFSGVIEAVSNVLDPQTRRILLRCSAPNANGQLKPEMYARIAVVNENHQLPKVNNSALVTEGLKTFVFVEKALGLLEKTEVELAFRGHETSFISKGLQGGERVVFAGALLLNAELAEN